MKNVRQHLLLGFTIFAVVCCVSAKRLQWKTGVQTYSFHKFTLMEALVDTLKRFKGRIKVVHMKDLSDKLSDTTWSTGVLPVKEVLEELKNQHFDGLVSVEYEDFGDSQLDDIRKSLNYYNHQIK